MTNTPAEPVWNRLPLSLYRGVLAVLLVVVLSSGWALAQERGDIANNETAKPDKVQVDTVKRETIFVDIKLNNRSIPQAEWGDIVMGQSDSLVFEFRCRISNKKKDPKLFDTELKGEDGNKRSERIHSPSALWRGLPQMRYTFTVQAVAPKPLAGRINPENLWEATPVVIDFRVDNIEAARREKERLALEAAARKDSLNNIPAPPPSRSFVEWGVYALVGCIVVAAAAAIAVQSIRQRRRTMNAWSPAGDASMNPNQTANIQHSAQKDSLMSNQGTLSYEQLQKENSALRAEIAALRGQIEALQVRTDELQKTNRELAHQKERLLDHKKQLEELQAQKDELFSMVVHDIKNPAGLIRGLVELLRSYDLTAQEQQEIMEDLMATSSRILSLAQEVSRIVTLESGNMKLDFVRYPVVRIIEDVCRRNQASAVKKSIEIQRDTTVILPDAEIDVNKMEEVLDNLVSNAIKFSDNGSSIKVRAGKSGERAVVEVIDNGPGLTEEDIKRAFGRGARLSAKPTGGESSSGLGLWIVKKIVEAHHGRVWVKSSVLKGSTFAFELPLVQPVADGEETAS